MHVFCDARPGGSVCTVKEIIWVETVTAARRAVKARGWGRMRVDGKLAGDICPACWEEGER